MPSDLNADQLLSAVKNLPYRECREYLRLHSDYSRFVFKYREVKYDDEESVERARAILVRNELWVSSPIDFNDPFDMSGKLGIGGSARERRDKIDAWLRLRRVPLKKREKEVARLAQTSIVELEQGLRDTWAGILQRTGVYCFAGDPKSILMWSHYARSHEGFCLGYERARVHVC